MKKTFIFTLFVASFIFSCAKKEFYPKDIYYQGIKAYQKGDYETAKEYLKKAIYKAKGMTLEDEMKAKFALADAYFKLKMYIDAIVEFEEYISLYPTAPNIPEALYKLSISYLKISPDYERDLTYAQKALEKAQELIINYPDSPYAKKAKKIITAVKTKEAKHYKAVADLYYHLGKNYSAAFYYDFLLKKYYPYIDVKKIKYLLAINLLKAENQYKDQIKEYKRKISQLDKKINAEKDIEKKNVLLNRKKLLENQLSTLEKRIKESNIRGQKILKELSKKSLKIEN